MMPRNLFQQSQAKKDGVQPQAKQFQTLFPVDTNDKFEIKMFEQKS